VVDEDAPMQHMLANFLEQNNLHVISAAQEVEETRQFAIGEPDLVVLDLRLGEENDLDLLREIRSRSEVPVIIITGYRCDEFDRAVGLELAPMIMSPSRSTFVNFSFALALSCATMG
jgi:two-component system, OmpR family, response regulator